MGGFWAVDDLPDGQERFSSLITWFGGTARNKPVMCFLALAVLGFGTVFLLRRSRFYRGPYRGDGGSDPWLGDGGGDGGDGGSGD
ncbi:hypothetical protein Acy02nite_17200 [Actinoplanes cyaneus]|uniref:Uncharacterized protein n=1 Tax=Actinoplanes cyaneus TaxID=52696 RepID=A0A919IDZ9_9ACTN|nr:hypothetical protein Acy02nite_17200 [Actinoplanes cyaneus]